MSIIRTLLTVFALITALKIATANSQKLGPTNSNLSAPRAEPLSPAPKAEPLSPAPKAEPVKPPIKPPKIDDNITGEEKANNLLEYANYVYSQKQWELASSYYQKYLAIQPSADESASAWYRLGESFLKQKDISSAEKSYLTIIEKFSSSEYFNAASYRIGSIYYSDNQYKKASTFFDAAKKNCH